MLSATTWKAGLRLLRTNPGLACTAIVALALGIGFTATMVAIVRGAARPLPVSEPHQVVAINKISSRGATGSLNTYAYDLERWADASTLGGVAAFQTAPVNLSGDGDAPERVSGAMLTANALDLLGVTPALGRAFSEGDALSTAVPVVLLSDTLWRRRFGGNRGIVGHTIRADGRDHVVAGVMPPGFGFPVSARIWTVLPRKAAATPGDGLSMVAFARLREGVALETARAELDALTAIDATASPSTHGGVGVRVVPFTEIETPREVVRGLYVLVAAVGLVLLIACANVASLLVVRGIARQRDIATRMAIGAGRGRIVGEQLAESLTLSAIAGVLGLAIAHAAVRVFATNTSAIIEAYWVDFRVDGLVVLIASGLAAAAAAAAGLGPALRVASMDAVAVLKDRGHGSTGRALGRVARRLPGAQIAFACALLGLTMLLGRAALDLQMRPWPFDADRILSAQYGIPLATLDDRERRNALMDRLVTALAAQPGVEAAGLVSALPGRGSNWSFSLDRPADAGAPALTSAAAFVTPGFFDVTGARVLAGRLIDARDVTGAPDVAVVTEDFARRFTPGESPLGRRLYLGARALTIVGVVGDLMARDIDEARTDGFYASIYQLRPFAVRVVARGAGDAASLVPLLGAATALVDPDLPLFELSSVRDAALADKAVLGVLSSLFLLFGAGALGLTAIGLYGVVSFAVAQRTREFGIRMALGAARADILRLVAREATWQVAGGLTAGVTLAFILTRAFAAAFERGPVADPIIFVVIAACVAATALLALAAPAWRALTLRLAVALRQT